jgi:hypothetical protein
VTNRSRFADVLPPSRLAAVTLWLLAGHAMLAGAMWGFLLIPESNVAMLLLSTATALAIVGATGMVENVALFAWSGSYAKGRSGLRARLADAWRSLPAFLAGAAVFLAIWLLGAHANAWWAAHRGEIDAWLIARFAWTDTRGLHSAIGWMTWLVRYVLGLSLALSLVHRGAAGVARPAWLIDALHPARLAAIAVCLLGLVVLPARYTGWRPEGLPASWVEAAFVAAKLGGIALAAHLGWALVLRAAAGRHVDHHSTTVQDFPA